MELPPDDREKSNVKAFHGNELIKEHDYALQKADTPRLQGRTQNVCSLISISGVILKLFVVKITSIFVSYRFLRMAWHDIFSLSAHFPASSDLYIPRGLAAELKSKCSSSRQV